MDTPCLSWASDKLRSLYKGLLEPGLPLWQFNGLLLHVQLHLSTSKVNLRYVGCMWLASLLHKSDISTPSCNPQRLVPGHTSSNKPTRTGSWAEVTTGSHACKIANARDCLRHKKQSLQLNCKGSISLDEPAVTQAQNK